MVYLAALIAVMLLMAFTPLGYLKTAGVEITFVMIPVIIGAVLLGPAGGAALGAVFGITSFIQAFGMSVFGATLLNINPFYTFIVCMVPRVLMGFLTGLIFKALYKNDNKQIMPFAVASLSGALLNTLFFMSALILLFGSTEYIKGLMGGMSLIAFVVAFVGLNGVIEAITCFIIATAIAKAVKGYAKFE